MVATDVASRGIGMIKNPFPCTATPSRLHSSALLSTLRRFLDCVILPGFFRVFWFSIIGCLGSVVQNVLCYFSDSKLKVLPPVQDAELAILDSSQAVSKTPQSEDLDVWITYPGIKSAMDSSCQMPREYWMHSHAASSLAALERCYTLFAVLANPSQRCPKHYSCVQL